MALVAGSGRTPLGLLFTFSVFLGETRAVGNIWAEKIALFPLTARRSVNPQWLYHCYLAQLASIPLWRSKQQRYLHFWGTLGSVAKSILSQCLPCCAVNNILASSHFPFNLSPEPFICDYFLATSLSMPAYIKLV